MSKNYLPKNDPLPSGVSYCYGQYPGQINHIPHRGNEEAKCVDSSFPPALYCGAHKQFVKGEQEGAFLAEVLTGHEAREDRQAGWRPRGSLEKEGGSQKAKGRGAKRTTHRPQWV